MLTRSMTRRNSSISFLELPDNESADESEFELESEYDSSLDTDYNEATDVFLSGYTEESEETDFNSSEEIDIEIEKDKKRIARRLELLNKLKDAEPKYPPYIENLPEDERNDIKSQLTRINEINKSSIPLKFKVLRTQIDISEKARIIKLLETFEKSGEKEGDFTKITQYINTIIDIPIGEYKDSKLSSNNSSKDINNYIVDTEKQLNKIIYGHNEAKLEILQYICRLISNPISGGTSLGIYGPAGIGKTTLVKDGIAKVLGRPFSFISLGGCSDASYLDGHCFTYEGSKPGMIVDILKKSNCMNPVIYFDELDKISETTRGDEIVNLLIHLTDTSQNSQFTDKYLGNGIKLDLSRVIFVFSFNDIEKINPILRDRIQMIKLNDFNTLEKVKIARDYLLPNIYSEFNEILRENITFTDEILEHLYVTYCNVTVNAGVRKFKELLKSIVSKINMLFLVSCDKNVLKLLDIEESTNLEFPIEFSNKNRKLLDKLLLGKLNSYELDNKIPEGMYS